MSSHFQNHGFKKVILSSTRSIYCHVLETIICDFENVPWMQSFLTYSLILPLEWLERVCPEIFTYPEKIMMLPFWLHTVLLSSFLLFKWEKICGTYYGFLGITPCSQVDGCHVITQRATIWILATIKTWDLRYGGRCTGLVAWVWTRFSGYVEGKMEVEIHGKNISLYKDLLTEIFWERDLYSNNVGEASSFIWHNAN
jgi:hypothetical protein